MNPALWISKTGLDAQQTNISVTSNNLANASTVGYKKARAIFEDLLYQNINQPGGRSSADTELPSGLMLGAGAKVVATQKNHSQGNVQTTDNSLDLMISGRGYFEIQLPDGSAAYTRNGQFTLNDEGTIVTPGNGYPLQPEIQIPENAQSVTVGRMVRCRYSSRGMASPRWWARSTPPTSSTPPACNPWGRTSSSRPSPAAPPFRGLPARTGWG